MKGKAYLGITGISTRREVSFCEMSFNKYGLSKCESHCGMIGLLMDNTFKKRNEKFVSVEEAFDLLDRMYMYKNIFKTIHYYSPYKAFADNIIKLLNTNGYNYDGDIYFEDLIDGIQLNLNKPNPDNIQRIKDDFPDIQIIFQYNDSFKDVINIEELSDSYNDLIDYVLIDPSKGKGISLDLLSKSSVELYYVLKTNFPNKILGFAGGFSEENVFDRCCRIRDFRGDINFSIDAQSKLRNGSMLDSNKVEQYVSNFMRFIRSSSNTVN